MSNKQTTSTIRFIDHLQSAARPQCIQLVCLWAGGLKKVRSTKCERRTANGRGFAICDFRMGKIVHAKAPSSLRVYSSTSTSTSTKKNMLPGPQTQATTAYLLLLTTYYLLPTVLHIIDAPGALCYRIHPISSGSLRMMYIAQAMVLDSVLNFTGIGATSSCAVPGAFVQPFHSMTHLIQRGTYGT